MEAAAAELSCAVLHCYALLRSADVTGDLVRCSMLKQLRPKTRAF